MWSGRCGNLQDVIRYGTNYRESYLVRGSRVKEFLSTLLNVVVTIISLFYLGTVFSFVIMSINYIIVNLNPNTVTSMTYSTFTFALWPGWKVIVLLILFGSTVYYYKSDKTRMKVISAIGCVSMILSAVIFKVLEYI